MTRVTVKVASNWRRCLTPRVGGGGVSLDPSWSQRWRKCEKCVAYPYGILLTTRMFGHKLNVLQGHINVWAWQDTVQQAGINLTRIESRSASWRRTADAAGRRRSCSAQRIAADSLFVGRRQLIVAGRVTQSSCQSCQSAQHRRAV